MSKNMFLAVTFVPVTRPVIVPPGVSSSPCQSLSPPRSHFGFGLSHWASSISWVYDHTYHSGPFSKAFHLVPVRKLLPSHLLIKRVSPTWHSTRNPLGLGPSVHLWNLEGVRSHFRGQDYPQFWVSSPDQWANSI